MVDVIISKALLYCCAHSRDISSGLIRTTTVSFLSVSLQGRFCVGRNIQVSTFLVH